jgi:hypothetical protein
MPRPNDRGPRLIALWRGRRQLFFGRFASETNAATRIATVPAGILVSEVDRCTLGSITRGETMLGTLGSRQLPTVALRGVRERHGHRRLRRSCAEFKLLGLAGAALVLCLPTARPMELGLSDRFPIRSDPGSGAFTKFQSLSDAWLDDFASLCWPAARHNRFSCCRRSSIFTSVSPVFPSLVRRMVKCGRADVIVDPHKRRQFFERVVDPIIAVCQRFPATIYALELINEPEWCTDDASYQSDKKVVPLASMLEFISEGAAQDQSGWLYARRWGSPNIPSMKAWDAPGLGLTLHQWHYYCDPEVVPDNDMASHGPCIVGEFPSGRWRAWRELGDAQDTRSRLAHLASKGYDGALLWSANREEEKIADPVVEWSERVRDEVAAFISRADKPVALARETPVAVADFARASGDRQQRRSGRLVVPRPGPARRPSQRRR